MMNKRIQKLFNEAGFHQPEMERLGIEDKFEKFALLIVRECIGVIEGMADPEEDSDRYFWAIQNASTKVREHFGVDG
jgi:hypothetical protein